MNVRKSEQVREFVRDLISNYADVDCLPDISIDWEGLDVELSRFSSLVMGLDSDLANDATSCQNDHYDTIMLPALLNYLNNPGDADDAAYFQEQWAKGINLYFFDLLKEMIEQEMEDEYEEDIEEEDDWDDGDLDEAA